MIESKIDDLIKAINANTAALAALSNDKAPAPQKPASKKATKTEDDLVAEALVKQRALEAQQDAAAEAAQKAKDAGPSKEQVAKAIEQCLKAGKKDELVALIKGFGAGNATSLFAKGPEVAAQFIEAAEALLLGE
jgi:hypothetical protein